MKSILSLLALLAAPVAAQACEGVGVVQSLGVVGHCAPVRVQSFDVPAVTQFDVQTVQPLYVAPPVVTFQAAPVVLGVRGVVVQQQDHCGGVVFNQGVVVRQKGHRNQPVVNALGALRPNGRDVVVTKTKIRQRSNR